MATTFTRKTQTLDPETGVMKTVETTVTGAAFRQMRGDPHVYAELGLSLTENPQLFFTPTTYGEVPKPGDEVTWPTGGTVYKVKSVNPLAPDGVVIAAKVVIGR